MAKVDRWLLPAASRRTTKKEFNYHYQQRIYFRFEKSSFGRHFSHLGSLSFETIRRFIEKALFCPLNVSFFLLEIVPLFASPAVGRKMTFHGSRFETPANIASEKHNPNCLAESASSARANASLPINFRVSLSEQMRRGLC